MRPNYFLSLIIIVIIVFGLFTYLNGRVDRTASIPDVIVVDYPQKGDAISSPLTVKGKARGNWYFEASFPVELRDEYGYVITQTPAQAKGEWMTSDFVPFEATITFKVPSYDGGGTLVLRKDNPSGDPARDASVVIPVTFK